MKWQLLLLLLALAGHAKAQWSKPDALSVSYFGEMITHPGLRLGAGYELKSWNKERSDRKGREKIIKKAYSFTPSLGFYFHKRYQTGIFLLPEIKYSRRTERGAVFALGLGAGYLRTIIPHTYEVGQSGDVNRTGAGHHYFLSSVFASFGKDLSTKGSSPLGYFIKPQLNYALPNFPTGVGYFALEVGMTYLLDH